MTATWKTATGSRFVGLRGVLDFATVDVTTGNGTEGRFETLESATLGPTGVSFRLDRGSFRAPTK